MSIKAIEGLDPKQFIIIKGARMHNLKNVSVALPRNKFIVITGLSGSGKSSLAFDTLFAEGQRRYVESLSSYARQFLGRLDKPIVDYIKGISPAVAIEQKVISRNSRSTVGTSTEIYDYVKLLFARTGKTISPISGKEVKKDNAEDVLAYIKSRKKDEKFVISSPVILEDGRKLKEQLEIYLQQGFSRLLIKDQIVTLDLNTHELLGKKQKPQLIIDRLAVKDDDSDDSRIMDSIEIAFFEGKGDCLLTFMGEKTESKAFSDRFELDGILFEKPSSDFFSFNNPVGACKKCEGFGSVIGIDEDLVIPNTTLSVFEGAVVCWRGDKMSKWKDELIKSAHHFDFPLHKPIKDLSQEHYDLLWNGNSYFEGIRSFFKMVEENTYKIQYRVMLSRYRGKTKCPECNGSRLRKDANYVKVGGKSITDLISMSIGDLAMFFQDLKLSARDKKIAKHLLSEIKNRLKYLQGVGLDYLTLSRLSNTLSGGESQRINLAVSLGSSLVGSMYILDEPSIGLHPRDTEKLIEVLISLRNLGNTVIVVEHDEEIMRKADYIIDMGPKAGTHGGEVVFEGLHKDLIHSKDSITAAYLTGKDFIPKKEKFRKWKNYVEVIGASENNLKNIDVKFPLGVLTSVVGVSGSGKSSLVQKILYQALKQELLNNKTSVGEHHEIRGSYSVIKDLDFIDQNPIGKSSRSNPVTYVKAFDDIRTLFASLPLSKSKGFKTSHYSYNVKGGRCETCEGEGKVTISMQFMADIKLQCDVCHGKRYKDETLQVRFQEKNIADVLQMTVDDAISFFKENQELTVTKKIITKLLPLQEVGLGYVQLGQSSSTLSGGEAQRVKLASYLTKGKSKEHTLFIFDEPTSGLHFDDVKKLLVSFEALINQGHTIIVVEHNKDVINASDWLIELGPVGGVNGGELLFEGTPADVHSSKKSVTAKYLV